MDFVSRRDKKCARAKPHYYRRYGKSLATIGCQPIRLLSNERIGVRYLSLVDLEGAAEEAGLLDRPTIDALRPVVSTECRAGNMQRLLGVGEEDDRVENLLGRDDRVIALHRELDDRRLQMDRLRHLERRLHRLELDVVTGLVAGLVEDLDGGIV